MNIIELIETTKDSIHRLSPIPVLERQVTAPKNLSCIVTIEQEKTYVLQHYYSLWASYFVRYLVHGGLVSGWTPGWSQPLSMAGWEIPWRPVQPGIPTAPSVW